MILIKSFKSWCSFHMDKNLKGDLFAGDIYPIETMIGKMIANSSIKLHFNSLLPPSAIRPSEVITRIVLAMVAHETIEDAMETRDAAEDTLAAGKAMKEALVERHWQRRH
ncbi:unnamed protein product [Sphenostylis stenocarpa]|uniref:Uncharacterized protein n=1 Tax=Sphenostylis stenocarpa TaxID=92480 RepID=A0AA86VF67_9FABA|nr:unnamed protein product [Sphenostylis stenocarpa]